MSDFFAITYPDLMALQSSAADVQPGSVVWVLHPTFRPLALAARLDAPAWLAQFPRERREVQRERLRRRAFRAALRAVREALGGHVTVSA